MGQIEIFDAMMPLKYRKLMVNRVDVIEAVAIAHSLGVRLSRVKRRLAFFAQSALRTQSSIENEFPRWPLDVIADEALLRLCVIEDRTARMRMGDPWLDVVIRKCPVHVNSSRGNELRGRWLSRKLDSLRLVPPLAELWGRLFQLTGWPPDRVAAERVRLRMVVQLLRVCSGPSEFDRIKKEEEETKARVHKENNKLFRRLKVLKRLCGS